MSRLNGSSSSSRDNTRRSGRRSQSGESLILCVLFMMWMILFHVNKHTFGPQKLHLFPPSLFGNTYKVPFLPSFPLSKHLQGSVHSFLFNGAALKEGGKMCTKYVGVRERESVFVISQSLKDCFSKLKILIN
jgi:hypothetical protein